MTGKAQRFCTQCGSRHAGPGELCVACTGVTQTLMGGPLDTPVDSPVVPPLELGDEPIEAVDASEIGVGSVVAGRYEVQRLLGEGGAGRVYLAWQPELERRIALKVLHPHLSADERLMQRFHREARAASQLRHPCAVVVHDFGTSDGQLFIAMEFLEGCTLADILETEFPLADHKIVMLLSQACEVLEEAHGLGIVHRDLKPENLMVVTDPLGRQQVKVVDFGLAVPTEAPPETRLTVENTVVGTPAYMSPEQCRGETVDHSSDLYTMGVILYELLAGTVPFDERNPIDLMVKTLLSVPTPPSKRRTDLDINELLESLALQALAKRTEARPVSATEFRERLQAAIEPGAGRPKSARATAAGGGLGGRAARAAAARLKTVPTRVTEAGASLTVAVAVVEPADDAITTLTARTRRAGFHAEQFDSVDAALEATAATPGILVVDVRSAPRAELERLAARLGAGGLREGDLLAVGPVDFEIMSRALELGVKNYLPEAKLDSVLPKTIRRLARRRRKR